MILMSQKQIQDYEKYLIKTLEFNSFVLMENAATSIFNYIKNNILSSLNNLNINNNLNNKKLKKGNENTASDIFFNNDILFNNNIFFNNFTITILAGNSNNGGDAIAVARKLLLFFNRIKFERFKINLLILNKKFSEENLYQQKIFKMISNNYNNNYDSNNNNNIKNNNNNNNNINNSNINIIYFLPEEIIEINKQTPVIKKDYLHYFDANIFIDGIFGIGLKGKLKENFALFFKAINNYKKAYNNYKNTINNYKKNIYKMDKPYKKSQHYNINNNINTNNSNHILYNFPLTIAIDLPSGLTEDYFNEPIFADIVLTLSYPKLSLFLPQNRKHYNKLEILDIEFPEPEDIDYYNFKIKDNNKTNNNTTNNNSKINKNIIFNFNLIDSEYIKSILIPRDNFANKGNFGRVCIISGNFNTIGASIISAKAAFNSGSGLVYLLGSKSNIKNIKSVIPEIITIDYEKDYIQNTELLSKIKTFLIGPGFGNNETLFFNLLKTIINILQDKKRGTIVIDAEGLNLFAKSLKIKDLILNNTDTINFIFTPHLLEFSRIMDTDIEDIKNNRIEYGKEFSIKNNIYLYLKDSITFSFSPDSQIACNYGCNGGFAKGGTGDFIAGIISSFVAQGYSPFESMNIASYILDCLTEYFDKNNISNHSYTPFLFIDALKFVLNKI